MNNTIIQFLAFVGGYCLITRLWKGLKWFWGYWKSKIKDLREEKENEKNKIQSMV